MDSSQLAVGGFNQTISLADLTARPTESFQVSEDRATTEAYSLYHDFLKVFQTSLDTESLLPTLESYAELTSESGKMLKGGFLKIIFLNKFLLWMSSELARQLALAGRNVDELKKLAEHILGESSTWRLLTHIVHVKEDLAKDYEILDDRHVLLINELF